MSASRRRLYPSQQRASCEIRSGPRLTRRKDRLPPPFSGHNLEYKLKILWRRAVLSFGRFYFVAWCILSFATNGGGFSSE
ncbi:hypothetical protein M440DRAFT_269044 [Trichoderma longibrachiatum ATCC 18648]|uniref:Uncharacterized protein n=1 Tax=Trichoderma longibrachiatum ATCC 18648 TaxID=983965 RepID=A0A2T4CB38_TRILO|nr:hypothetical protein M440DRAFT_269044 [Trichoderma longibrachiatum ATCC 18648]